MFKVQSSILTRDRPKLREPTSIWLPGLYERAGLTRKQIAGLFGKTFLERGIDLESKGVSWDVVDASSYLLSDEGEDLNYLEGCMDAYANDFFSLIPNLDMPKYGFSSAGTSSSGLDVHIGSAIEHSFTVSIEIEGEFNELTLLANCQIGTYVPATNKFRSYGLITTAPRESLAFEFPRILLTHALEPSIKTQVSELGGHEGEVREAHEYFSTAMGVVYGIHQKIVDPSIQISGLRGKYFEHIRKRGFKKSVDDFIKNPYYPFS